MRMPCAGSCCSRCSARSSGLNGPAASGVVGLVALVRLEGVEAAAPGTRARPRRRTAPRRRRRRCAPRSGCAVEAARRLRIDARRGHAGRRAPSARRPRWSTGTGWRAQRPQVAPRRRAAREHAALDRQPVVPAPSGTRACPRPGRCATGSPPRPRCAVASLKASSFLHQRERDARLGRLRRAARAAAACRRGRRWPRRAGSLPRSRTAPATRSRRRADRRAFRLVPSGSGVAIPEGAAPCRLEHRATSTRLFSWMIGSSTASTISITTPPIATISSGSRIVAICSARRCTSAPSWLRGARRASCGSWPVCSPRRENIASRPGKRFLPASAEASGAPSRTCTSASIASARIARLRQRLGRRLQRLQDRHAGAGQHRQRAGEARRVVAAREPADQRQVEPAGVEALAERLVAQLPSAARRRRPAISSSSSQPQLRTKALIAEHRHGQHRQRALRAGEHRSPPAARRR